MSASVLSPRNATHDRAHLVGSNVFEMLLFRLRSGAEVAPELYGINVFKVREIAQMPDITAVVGNAPSMLGVVNLRGQLIPVIDLARALGLSQTTPSKPPKILLVTEFSRTTQGFAVDEVDEIVRLDWKQIMSAEESSTARSVTSFARLDEDNENSRLAQVLDVEQVLRDVMPEKAATVDVTGFKGLDLPAGARVIAADDSAYARALIEQSLIGLHVPFTLVKSGREAWDVLQAAKAQAIKDGVALNERIGLVVTDLEMPEMDGFTLTRHIKEDPVMANIPVVIHSSLSGSATEDQGRRVGADAFVAKFVAEELAQAMNAAIAKRRPALQAA